MVKFGSNGTYSTEIRCFGPTTKKELTAESLSKIKIILISAEPGIKIRYAILPVFNVKPELILCINVCFNIHFVSFFYMHNVSRFFHDLMAKLIDI